MVFRGIRRSVIISVESAQLTQFGIETIIYDTKSHSEVSIISVDTNRDALSNWPLGPLRMRFERYLADALDLLFLEIGISSTQDLRFSFVELITAVVLSLSGSELHCEEYVSPPCPAMA
jgi:hypothetical protein